MLFCYKPIFLREPQSSSEIISYEKHLHFKNTQLLLKYLANLAPLLPFLEKLQMINLDKIH